MQVETSDFYLCAYLRLSGVVLKDLREDGRRHLFVFDDNEQLQNLKRAYYFNQAQVDPLSFKRSIRELKSLIMGE